MAHVFHSLSIEINQMIGLELENDTDLGTYRLICISTKNAIDGDNYSFWRKRFLTKFDAPSASGSSKRCIANESIIEMYQLRRKLLRRGATFEHGGSTQAENNCLLVVRDLVVDSFCGVNSLIDEDMKACSFRSSKNMRHINRFINNYGLLDNICSPVLNNAKMKHSPLLLAVQLVLTYFSLTTEPNTSMAKAWRFPLSQQMVYLPTKERPILTGPSGLEVDIEWCLHVTNFFKLQLLGQNEALSNPYKHLTEFERPQCWMKPLGNEPQKLGTHWRGAYAWVEPEELHEIRRGDNEEYPVQDQLNGQDGVDGFQTLELSTGGTDIPWPDMFERVLKSLTKPVACAKTRAQKRALDTTSIGKPVAFQFQGKGQDNTEDFLSSGWLNPLPPQQGIPGWMRMTMMKYYMDRNGAMDMASLWAYEGIVLPGGMIIIGRWWHPVPGEPQDEYTGPFILWNVDSSFAEAGYQATEGPNALNKPGTYSS